MRPLPKVHKYNHTYKLSEFIGKNNDYIRNNKTGYIYVDNLELIKNNLDFLLYLLDIQEICDISCPNYECIKYINNNVFDLSLKCNLLDDGKNIDRSYINIKELENIDYSIPLVYLLWGVEFDKLVNVSVLQYADVKCAFSINGNKTLSKNHLIKIKELIKELSNIKCNNDIEKNILVSNYIQQNIQYIDNVVTNTHCGTYIVDPKGTRIEHAKSSLIETVIDENYGICMSIANTTSMLLNNPIFNVDIRDIYGSSHVWNIVKIGDKSYYVDNTWAITRNKNKVNGALKANKFTDEFLFFGEEKAKELGHHDSRSSFFNYNISNNNLDKTEVIEAKHNLEKVLKYNYGYKTPFTSRRK